MYLVFLKSKKIRQANSNRVPFHPGLPYTLQGKRQPQSMGEECEHFEIKFFYTFNFSLLFLNLLRILPETSGWGTFKRPCRGTVGALYVQAPIFFGTECPAVGPERSKYKIKILYA